MFKWFELGKATHVIKEKYDMEWWTHEHKEMKHEMEIMVTHKE